MFYNGPELRTSIFGAFLSIPAITTDLNSRSYFDITQTLPPGNERGAGQLFGASALVGQEQLFQDAYRHWSNFSSTFKHDLSMSVLAFTPVLDPQIDAGLARGGNAIDPPSGGYAAVQLAKTFSPGVLNVPASVDEGSQLLFQQCVPYFISMFGY